MNRIFCDFLSNSEMTQCEGSVTVAAPLRQPGRASRDRVTLPSHWVISTFDKKSRKFLIITHDFLFKYTSQKNGHFKGVLLNLLDSRINLRISSKFNKTPLK